MVKIAMLVLVALAFTACATAPASAPPASQAKVEGCDWPAYLDKNERYAKGNMGGATPKLGTYACGGK